jgi:DNA-directed RNA polymerase II subunit RPB11
MATPYRYNNLQTGDPDAVESTGPGPFYCRPRTPAHLSSEEPLPLDPLPSNRPAHLVSQQLRASGRGLGPARDMISMSGPDADNIDLPRHLLFTLEPGEKKIDTEEDSRKYRPRWSMFTDRVSGIPNTSIFTLNKEDHTLGNLLSSRLRSKPYILFAGYKAPHPLIAKVELRIGTDGTITPKDALIEACKEVVLDLEKMSSEFSKEVSLYHLHKTGNPSHDQGMQLDGQ